METCYGLVFNLMKIQKKKKKVTMKSRFLTKRFNRMSFKVSKMRQIFMTVREEATKITHPIRTLCLLETTEATSRLFKSNRSYSSEGRIMMKEMDLNIRMIFHQFRALKKEMSKNH